MGAMMKGVKRFQDRLKKDLEHKEFKKAFEEEDFFSRLAVQIARIREEQGLSQKELAKRLHTSQQMISRLEDPSNQSLSLTTLVKLARVLHKRIELQFL